MARAGASPALPCRACQFEPKRLEPAPPKLWAFRVFVLQSVTVRPKNNGKGMNGRGMKTDFSEIIPHRLIPLHLSFVPIPLPFIPLPFFNLQRNSSAGHPPALGLVYPPSSFSLRLAALCGLR
jgi:hypothetical protein